LRVRPDGQGIHNRHQGILMGFIIVASTTYNIQCTFLPRASLSTQPGDKVWGCLCILVLSMFGYGTGPDGLCIHENY
jgi:hypothetical protein